MEGVADQRSEREVGLRAVLLSCSHHPLFVGTVRWYILVFAIRSQLATRSRHADSDVIRPSHHQTASYQATRRTAQPTRYPTRPTLSHVSIFRMTEHRWEFTTMAGSNEYGSRGGVLARLHLVGF